jgi:UDP-GlcNAc:undecaprenyl-phosphate GlcNAc-1-phosphate transferase
MFYLYGIAFVAALMMALIMTPLVKRFAILVGAVDAPNHRKVHTTMMPRLGGLAIFMAFVGAFFIILPALPDFNRNAVWGLLIGGAIIVLIGALDDRFELTAKVKLLGQLIAACVVVAFGLRVELLNIPFGDSFTFNMEWLSILVTILWIIGVTNAINLIDGLDGLAAGVSAIATATMLVMAIIMGNIPVVLLCCVLLGSIIGFLFFNFYPAKIFMGDSGALFLGFALATLSILGFKQAAFVSFVVPLLILGVPLSDTLFAIIRRIVQKQPISVADKSHLHHCLLQLGFGHRKTVLIIYGISAIFGICAIAFTQATQWVTILLIAVILIGMEVAAEAIGIISKGKKPVIHFLQKVSIKTIKFLGTRTLK